MSHSEYCGSPQCIGDALRRRLHPNSNMSVKQLAYAVRASERQVWSWIGGGQMPSGRHLLSLIEFLDTGFISEITKGASVTRLSDRRAIDAAAKIAEGMAELKALEGGR